jgi:CMP/dCMP kinase
MIISISGVPGSGKTSAAQLLAKSLGMKFYSVGDLRGKMALDRGITIDELNKLGENDPTSDHMADDYQQKLGETEDQFVIEGRLSWHFIPKSFKILLLCDPTEAARRIYGSQKSASTRRADEPEYEDVAHAQRELEKRMTSDALRYKKYYNLDYRDPKNFDLVVDTTTLKNAQETADAIAAELKKKGLVSKAS